MTSKNLKQKYSERGYYGKQNLARYGDEYPYEVIGDYIHWRKLLVLCSPERGRFNDDKMRSFGLTKKSYTELLNVMADQLVETLRIAIKFEDGRYFKYLGEFIENVNQLPDKLRLWILDELFEDDDFKEGRLFYLDGFDLRLVSAENLNGLPKRGKGVVIITTINTTLHFRIFDEKGKRILNEDGKDFSDLKNELGQLHKDLDDLWNTPNLSAEKKTNILIAVASFTGHLGRETAKQIKTYTIPQLVKMYNKATGNDVEFKQMKRACDILGVEFNWSERAGRRPKS